jgi:hypothetical protein
MGTMPNLIRDNTFKSHKRTDCLEDSEEPQYCLSEVDVSSPYQDPSSGHLSLGKEKPEERRYIVNLREVENSKVLKSALKT